MNDFCRILMQVGMLDYKTRIVSCEFIPIESYGLNPWKYFTYFLKMNIPFLFIKSFVQKLDGFVIHWCRNRNIVEQLTQVGIMSEWVKKQS